MAIDLLNTAQNKVREWPVAASATINNEGSPLISVIESGEKKVKLCAGEAGEVFAGFSRRNYGTPDTDVMVVDATVPASPDGNGRYLVQLDKGSLVANTARVRNVTAGSDLTVTWSNAGVPNAGTVDIETTGSMDFNVAQAGASVRVWVRRNLTVVEARMTKWQSDVNRGAVEILSSISVLEGPGFVFTDQFDPTKVWDTGATPVAVHLGASGLLTTTNTGTKIGTVIHAPGTDSSYLGVSINEPN